MSTTQDTLAEVTVYGGIPMSRRDVLTLATEHLGPDARDKYGADWFAFSLHPRIGVAPVSLDEARARFASVKTF